jgi:pseudomonalisin
MRNVVQLAITVAASLASVASAQTWVSTATKALPLANATQLGPLSTATPMHIVVGLKVQNAAQIQPTLKRMLTPGDPLYGTSFSVAQFVSQFGPTASQVEAVENYLSSYGFTNLSVSDNSLVIEADGTAAQVQSAFNTALATFSMNGQTVFANTMDAQVPSSLSGTVLSVLGLNNIAGFRIPLQTAKCTLDVCVPSAIPPSAFGPQDYQIAYDALYPADATGGHANKEKLTPGCDTVIGIISEGDLGTVSKSSPNGPGVPTNASTGVVHDLYEYEHNFHLPGVPVTVVYAGIPSADTSGADEWDLDSQTSTGIANQVKALYFYVATSLTDSDIGLAINKAVSQNKVKAFNMSFGECEFFPYLDGAMLLDDEMFGEAALQGMTPFASADDNGSACPVLPTNGVPASGPPFVSYPASSPYVTAVGGTDLVVNADFTYDGETAWYAGGGGVSVFETSPFWQAYTGSGTLPIVPSTEDGIRGVPDVAMCADPNVCGAIIYSTTLGSTSTSGTPPGSYCCVGGTSLSSPLSMGSWARIESAHNNKLGFAGPLIYQLANGAAAGPPPALPSSPYFNDVQLGSDGIYTAGPGWDYTTGLGSWDIFVVNEKVPSSYPH